MDGYSDADFAGCRATRRSTMGGYISRGAHVVRALCATQRTIALSLAEPELYGYVRCAAEVLGVGAFAKDLGLQAPGTVRGYSAAALGVVRRFGVGKLRQIDTSLLWVQQVHDDRILAFTKVFGYDNGADIFTKALSQGNMRRHILNMRGEMMDEDGGAGDNEQLDKIDTGVLTLISREQNNLGLQ